MQKWEKYSKEELEEFVRTSFSYAELARKCGYQEKSGSSCNSIKTMIEQYHFNIEHFTHKGWNKENFDYSRFTSNSYIKNGNATKALIHLRGHQCECCKNTKWNNKPIPLEVHHKDGNRTNNELSNLELLCPNCHALTDNWCGKNIKPATIVSEQRFVEALQNNTTIRKALIELGLTPKGDNYSRARELIIKYDIKHLQ